MASPWTGWRRSATSNTGANNASRLREALFAPVLLVADLFHPFHGLAIELFLNGDVRHGGGCRGAVPMLLTRRNPDHVTGPNLLDRASPTLRAATARRHDQRLAEWVRVPCRPGTGLERDAGARHARRIRGLEQRVDTYSAGEPLSRSSAGGL